MWWKMGRGGWWSWLWGLGGEGADYSDKRLLRRNGHTDTARTILCSESRPPRDPLLTSEHIGNHIFSVIAALAIPKAS